MQYFIMPDMSEKSLKFITFVLLKSRHQVKLFLSKIKVSETSQTVQCVHNWLLPTQWFFSISTPCREAPKAVQMQSTQKFVKGFFEILSDNMIEIYFKILNIIPDQINFYQTVGVGRFRLLEGQGLEYWGA